MRPSDQFTGAVVLPALVLLAVLGVWAVLVGAAQVRCANGWRASTC